MRGFKLESGQRAEAPGCMEALILRIRSAALVMALVTISGPTIVHAQGAPAPDWSGAWDMARGGARLMFDPNHAYMAPDPAKELRSFDFGPMGGSYLTEIPYKPAVQAEYMAKVAKAKEGFPSDPVGAGCRPYGMPRVMSATPYGPAFVFSSDIIVILLGDETRRVYMDGRAHPQGDLAIPSWEGHSVGHWEGQELVIDTVNVLAGNYDQSNASHSDQIHVVERIRQSDANTLENTITVEDPELFTKPWTIVKQYKRAKQKFPEVLSSNCGAASQVSIIDGVQVQKLPFE